MNTLAEVVDYWRQVYAAKQQAPSAQEEAFAKTLRQDGDTTHGKNSTMNRLPPTANATSTAQIPEDEVLALMEDHGVRTQVINDRIQALSIWTDKHAGGGIGSEWVDIVCRRDWIRAFLGY